MMTRINLFLFFSLFFGTLYAQSDSLCIVEGDEIEIGNSYTLRLDGVALTTNESVVSCKVMRKYNGALHGLTVYIESSRIYAVAGNDTTLLASDLPDGMNVHDYRLIRYNTTYLRLYRDGAWIGVAREAKLSDDKFYIAIYGIQNLRDGYACELTSATEALFPNEEEGEDNINDMLIGRYTNLAGDPFCSKGFDRVGENSSTRTFYTNKAVYSGWGPSTYMDSESAYSGKYCIRLEGQAVYPSLGASLDQAINFSSQSNYLVRAMVKSDGYEGKLGIAGEDAYIPISDTGGEWRLVEGVLSTTAARVNLFINIAEIENEGTLYVAYFVVYNGHVSTSTVGITSSLPAVMIHSTNTWFQPRAT